MSTRFVGKTGKPTKKAATTTSRTNQIPLELLNNNQLNSLISQSLPQNYNFELHKTIHQVNQNNVAILGLQMPEGLLQFSLIISDIINKFCPNCHQIIVLGDVTYGACCVDDYTAKALGCQMLIHYGHSCLIPVDQTSIKTLYVFVEIGIDRQHLADTIKANFPACMHQEQEEEKNRTIKHVSISHEEEQELHLALVGTVQFVSAVQALKHELEQPSSQSNQPKMITPSAPDTIQHHHHHHQPCRFKVTVPQVKPLSPGEILGCTAPKLSPEIDAILYLGDGRFHLESIMIANPTIPAFRYDPYEKKITHEGYDHAQMRAVRANAIEIARESLRAEREDSERGWAVVLGTLGRQGSLNVLKSITTGIATRAGGTKMVIPILLSELSAGKLGLLREWMDVCVQTSCPRLSIDWGHDFLVDGAGRVVPLLNPYEAKVALGQAQGFQPRLPVPATESLLLDSYPMDFYADESLGDWTPRHGRSLRPGRRPVPAQLSVT